MWTGEYGQLILYKLILENDLKYLKKGLINILFICICLYDDEIIRYRMYTNVLKLKLLLKYMNHHLIGIALAFVSLIILNLPIVYAELDQQSEEKILDQHLQPKEQLIP